MFYSIYYIVLILWLLSGYSLGQNMFRPSLYPPSFTKLFSNLYNPPIAYSFLSNRGIEEAKITIYEFDCYPIGLTEECRPKYEPYLWGTQKFDPSGNTILVIEGTDTTHRLSNYVGDKWGTFGDQRRVIDKTTNKEFLYFKNNLESTLTYDTNNLLISFHDSGLVCNWTYDEMNRVVESKVFSLRKGDTTSVEIQKHSYTDTSMTVKYIPFADGDDSLSLVYIYHPNGDFKSIREIRYRDNKTFEAFAEYSYSKTMIEYTISYSLPDDYYGCGKTYTLKRSRKGYWKEFIVRNCHSNIIYKEEYWYTFYKKRD